MNAVRKQRLILVVSILVGLAIACGLMFYALRQNINLFFTPQQVMAGEAPLDTQMRVGILVMKRAKVVFIILLLKEVNVRVKIVKYPGRK